LCENVIRQLQSEAESMTSRTSHSMATAAVQPLEDRLRRVQLRTCHIVDSTDMETVGVEVNGPREQTSSIESSTGGKVTDWHWQLAEGTAPAVYVV